MKPTKEWLTLWKQNRDKLKGSTSLNDYFTLPEIAGCKLVVLPIGDCSLPTGEVLVRDPLVYLGIREEQPYFQSVPAGIWPTELCVVTPGNGQECDWYAAARVCFSGEPAVRFEQALMGNEDLTDLDDDTYFGFCVDAGLGCICDKVVQQAFCDFMDHWEEAHPGDNLYNDYFAALFAENAGKHPAHHRDSGVWLNWVIPGTDYHLPIFQSGFGDGVYPVYFGYDVDGAVCQLMVSFFDVKLAYGRPGDNLFMDDFNCENGLCMGKVALEKLDTLFHTQGPYTLFFDTGSRDTMTDFNDLQRVGYSHLIENQGEIAEVILAELLKEYPSMQEDYGYDEAEKAELMPDATDAAALSKLLSPKSVIIHPVERDGLPYIGYEFGCTWEEEHGFGAMLHGTRVVKIGGADTALLTWIARRDAECV